MEDKIKNTMVKAIQHYAKKYEIADLTKVHLKMHLKEQESETDIPISFNIVDVVKGNMVIEKPIIEEILQLRKNVFTKKYIDLLNEVGICTSYIFFGLMRYAEENNISAEQISINIVHNGKQKKEASVKFYLVNGLDYNNGATIIGKITIADFIGLKTTIKMLEASIESGQLDEKQQKMVEAQYQEMKQEIEKQDAKTV